jgi:flagellar motor switch protein FliN/FliY
MMSKEEQKVAVSAQPVALQELPMTQPQGAPTLNGRLDLISELKVRIEARLGETGISVGELFSLRENSIVPLEAAPTDPVELLLDGKLIARGSLVVVGETFGVRITEVSDAGKGA